MRRRDAVMPDRRGPAAPKAIHRRCDEDSRADMSFPRPTAAGDRLKRCCPHRRCSGAALPCAARRLSMHKSFAKVVFGMLMVGGLVACGGSDDEPKLDTWGDVFKEGVKTTCHKLSECMKLPANTSEQQCVDQLVALCNYND